MAAAAAATCGVTLSLAVLAAPGRDESRGASAPRPAAAVSAVAGGIAFEPNAGRLGRAVDYVSRGRGYRLLLGARRSQLVLGGGEGVLGTRLVGAADRRAEAGDRLRTRVNSYVGERDRWRSGLATWARVRYRDVWSGIDVVYHGRRGALEYDFVVAPGADPGRVLLDIDGASAVRLARNGDLVATVGGTTVRQQRPVSYQRIGGRRVPVASRFVLDGDRVSFRIGDYDRGRTLVIDPTLVFGDYVGGGGADNGGRIAVDPAGNIYLAATSASASIPGGAAVKRAKSTGLDAFVMKINPSGTREWITYLGSTGTDQATDIALDGSNRPYVVGNTGSTGFPTANSNFQPTYQGGFRDGFVTALNGDGSIRWSTFFGSPDNDAIGQVAVTPSGHVYATRTAHSGPSTTVTPPMAGYLFVLTSSGSDSGSGFQYATTTDDSVDAVALVPGCDATNCQAYIGGHTKVADPDGQPGDLIRVGYLYRWNFATGTAVWYSEFTTPTDNDQNGTPEWPGGEWPTALTTDPGGHPVVVGTTKVDTHSWMFLHRFNKDEDNQGPVIDTPFVQFSVPPLNGDSFAGDVATDPEGNVYVIGTTLATNGSTQDGVQDRAGGAYDAAVMKYFPDGPPVRVDPNDPPASHPNARIVWSTFLGGADNDLGLGLAVDSSGGTYVSGEAGSTFLASPATQPLGATPDAFVAKIQTNGAAISEGPSGTIRSRDVTFKYSSGETGGSHECRLIGPGSAPGFSSCNGTSTFNGLADGGYTFEIESRDRGGTRGPRTSRAFTVDTNPVATFTIAPNPALAGRAVTFDGSASQAATPITAFEWDLDGNGSFETSTGTAATASQVYPAPGTFAVTLRVTDSEGKRATASGELRVNAAAATGTQFGVSINNGARYTNKPDVVVRSVFPAFTTSLLFSNDGGFGSAQSFPPRADTNWKLDSSGPERLPKTIYVRFLAGTIPGETLQDDIILDETPPVVQQAAVAGAATASGAARASALRKWRVRVRARDSNSGVGRVQVTASKRKPGRLLVYKRKLTVRSAKRPKWVRARDKAGNFSRWKRAR